jgi:hypothetical protein
MWGCALREKVRVCRGGRAAVFAVARTGRKRKTTACAHSPTKMESRRIDIPIICRTILHHITLRGRCIYHVLVLQRFQIREKIGTPGLSLNEPPIRARGANPNVVRPTKTGEEVRPGISI